MSSALFRISKVASKSVLDETLSLGVESFLALSDALVGLLLCTHGCDHANQVTCYHISLLLLSGKWTLGTLQALLLVLLHASGVFGILTHGTLIGVAEEDALLLGRYIWSLLKHLAFFFDQDRGDSFINTLGSLCLIIFILRILEAKEILSHAQAHLGAAADLFLHMFLLLLEDVASEFNVGDEPVVSVGLPFGACLNLHVLDSWNELVDDEMFEADLSCELSDTIHEILSLTMDDLSDVVELVLGHAEASLDTLRLILDFFELLLVENLLLLWWGKVVLICFQKIHLIIDVSSVLVFFLLGKLWVHVQKF